MPRPHFIAPLLFTLSFACGGEEAPPEATFSSVYSGVLSQGCSCHMTPEGAGGLGLRDQATAYASLVGAAATVGGACAGDRVQAFDPAASVLYRKLSGDDACGAPMPLGGQLSASDLALVRAWIEAGAEND